MDLFEEAQRSRGRRAGWRSINLPATQYDRVRRACERGYARNNDEFVRIWTEVGLTLTSLAPLQELVVKAAEDVAQEPVPGRGP